MKKIDCLAEIAGLFRFKNDTDRQRRTLPSGDKMDIDILEQEKWLKESSQNSPEALIRYILFELQSPIEDPYLAIDLLTENSFTTKDIRLAVLGAYLSSTWLNFKKNSFLALLDRYLADADEQNKAIIYYLHAYDIYMRCDEKYPQEYSGYLRRSISHAKRFVYNYVRLSEITERGEARTLMDQAISHVETVWSEEQLKKAPAAIFREYDHFVDEFILGVDISVFAYEELIAKRRSL